MNLHNVNQNHIFYALTVIIHLIECAFQLFNVQCVNSIVHYSVSGKYFTTVYLQKFLCNHALHYLI